MSEAIAQTTQSSSQQPNLAMLRGEPVLEIPNDLYIPPEAMEVFLDAFSGPLDFLLYLIKRNNLDILDIPIADITQQYMQYVDVMKALNLELAAEYLVMAATLAEIKSRMLLPRPVNADDETDPRAELVRRLQEYERFKDISAKLDSLPRVSRDIHLAKADSPDLTMDKPLPDVSLKELVLAFQQVMQRIDANTHHHISREPLSIRERMTAILSRVKSHEFIDFTDLFCLEEGRAGVVVSFIAMLELIRESLIEIVQAQAFAPIHIKARA